MVNSGRFTDTPHSITASENLKQHKSNQVDNWQEGKKLNNGKYIVEEILGSGGQPRQPLAPPFAE